MTHGKLRKIDSNLFENFNIRARKEPFSRIYSSNTYLKSQKQDKLYNKCKFQYFDIKLTNFNTISNFSQYAPIYSYFQHFQQYFTLSNSSNSNEASHILSQNTEPNSCQIHDSIISNSLKKSNDDQEILNKLIEIINTTHTLYPSVEELEPVKQLLKDKPVSHFRKLLVTARKLTKSIPINEEHRNIVRKHLESIELIPSFEFSEFQAKNKELIEYLMRLVPLSPTQLSEVIRLETRKIYRKHLKPEHLSLIKEYVFNEIDRSNLFKIRDEIQEKTNIPQAIVYQLVVKEFSKKEFSSLGDELKKQIRKEIREHLLNKSSINKTNSTNDTLDTQIKMKLDQNFYQIQEHNNQKELYNDSNFELTENFKILVDHLQSKFTVSKDILFQLLDLEIKIFKRKYTSQLHSSFIRQWIVKNHLNYTEHSLQQLNLSKHEISEICKEVSTRFNLPHYQSYNLLQSVKRSMEKIQLNRDQMNKIKTKLKSMDANEKTLNTVSQEMNIPLHQIQGILYRMKRENNDKIIEASNYINKLIFQNNQQQYYQNLSNINTKQKNYSFNELSREIQSKFELSETVSNRIILKQWNKSLRPLLPEHKKAIKLAISILEKDPTKIFQIDEHFINIYNESQEYQKSQLSWYTLPIPLLTDYVYLFISKSDLPPIDRSSIYFEVKYLIEAKRRKNISQEDRSIIKSYILTLENYNSSEIHSNLTNSQFRNPQIQQLSKVNHWDDFSIHTNKIKEMLPHIARKQLFELVRENIYGLYRKYMTEQEKNSIHAKVNELINLQSNRILEISNNSIDSQHHQLDTSLINTGTEKLINDSEILSMACDKLEKEFEYIPRRIIYDQARLSIRRLKIENKIQNKFNP